MEHAGFTITYNGPDVDNGEMDIADLAPSLMGLSALLKLANEVVNGNDIKTGLRIKAVRSNCFSVDLSILLSVPQQMRQALVGLGIRDAKDLVSFLADSGAVLAVAVPLAYASREKLTSVFQALKRCAGARVKALGRAAGWTLIELVDGQQYVLPDEVFRTVVREEVQKAVRNLVAPMRSGGVTSIVLSGDALSEPLKIDAADARRMQDDLVLEEEVVQDNVTTMAVTIVTVDFRRGNKWQLDDGVSVRWLEIRDAKFLSDIESGTVAFRNGDMLTCAVRNVQTLRNGKLSTESYVQEVLRHHPYRPPDELPFQAE